MPNEKSTADVLYHYTTQAGLLGILKNKVLWASHIHYLNDRKEFWHAFDVAHEKIRERFRQTSDLSETQKLEVLGTALDRLKHANVFVGSFSKDGDSLSQWRAYGGDGNGFAIGFSRTELKRLAKINGWRLGSCVYDLKEQIDKISSLIDSKMATDFETGRISSNPTNPNEIYVLTPDFEEFSNKISKIAPLVKHSAFRDEREWRLVADGPAKIDRTHHRPGRSMLIPYCEFPLAIDEHLNCITHITIGPTPHMELSERSLSSYLHSNGCEKVLIQKSEIPYRTW